MDNSYKPKGYNSLSPYFVIENAQEIIDLLKQIFNAKEMRKYHRPDGSIMHEELKIDDTILMIGGATGEHAPIEQMVHLYVPDVDTAYQKALELGCESILKPMVHDDDRDKRGAFKDFAGNQWWIATQIDGK